MTLPHNIERRLFSGTMPAARYRGWDAAGAMYWITGQPGSWAATHRDSYRATVFAPTLAALGDKLADIGKERAA